MISVIIPALDEEKLLPGTLDSLRAQPGDFETIVVDGASRDATARIARTRPQVKVIDAPRGRAAQMNAGAALARGEFLLFLHADTLLPSRAIRTLNALEADASCIAGGFRQRFSGTHPALRFVSWLHNTRCRWTGIFYGDQAMFVRRRLFEALGGFPAEPILEDILLSENLRRHGEPRLLDLSVTTDSRKFEQMGPWRSLARCLMILTCYELRLPIVGREFFTPVR